VHGFASDEDALNWCAIIMANIC